MNRQRILAEKQKIVKKKKKTRIWMEIKHMLTEIKNDFTRDISRLGTPEEILVNLIN